MPGALMRKPESSKSGCRRGRTECIYLAWNRLMVLSPPINLEPNGLVRLLLNQQ